MKCGKEYFNFEWLNFERLSKDAEFAMKEEVNILEEDCISGIVRYHLLTH